MAEKYDLEERLLDFSANVVEVVESLTSTRAGNHVAGQLIRCGTSPLANYAEAQSGESRKDFIHKIKLALKELRETRVWLMLIGKKALSQDGDSVGRALDECNQLIAIFHASASTAERNLRSRTKK